MGSNDHYPEERPAHLVAVDGFWIDRYPVTNERFARFVEATGHRTFAEVAPDPAQYPGALPEMLYAGSMVFVRPSGPVDRRQIGNWWTFMRGADWRHPQGPHSLLDGRDRHPVVHVAFTDAEALAQWEGKSLPTEAEWELAARGGLEGAAYAWGDTLLREGRHHMANTWQGTFPWENLVDDGYEYSITSRCVSSERLRPLRHDRQHLGMDNRLVPGQARERCRQTVLRAAQSARREGRGQLRSPPA